MATIEKLKKKRSAYRASATKAIGAVGVEADFQKLRVKINTLRTIADTLKELDESILNELLNVDGNEDACIEETMHCVTVQEDLLQALLEAEDKVEGLKPSVASCVDAGDNFSVQSNVASASSTMSSERLRLPKITLEVFDLGPGNWINFWTQFQRIHEDSNITNVDKFSYLKMSLKGQARKLVDSYPHTSENYVKVLEHLKNRFGKDEMVINCMYKDLLQLVRSDLSVTDLYDNISTKLRSLETLGMNSDRAAILVPLIEECLPIDVLKIWERRAAEEDDDSGNKIDKLLCFLGKEAESEQRLRNHAKVNEVDKFTAPRTEPTAAALVSFTPTVRQNRVSYQQTGRPHKVTLTCLFCNENHPSYKCSKEMSVEDRRKTVKEKRACFACLQGGHSRQQCRKRIDCGKCKGRHYDIMCVGEPSRTASLFAGPSGTVILKTLVAQLRGVTVRILLDTASHRSYISEAICEKLGLIECGRENICHMLFGGSVSSEISHPIHEIELTSLQGDNSFVLKALREKKICGLIPPVNDPHLLRKVAAHGITLTDDGVNRPIDVLLGADVMGELVTGVKCIDSKLLAFETKLGWCLLGTAERQEVSSMTNFVTSLLNLHHPLWDLEVIGIEKQTETKTSDVDDRCLRNFEDTIRFEGENCRYVVTLPWIDEHPPLPTNREIAESRLKSTVSRLDNNGLYDAYDTVFKQWETDGIIEITSDENIGHFLPHRPVINYGKTTKIRPVFDASAKSIGNVSLNDCLATGPNLIASIVPILLRFRLQEVGVVGDIKQAFLMIGLNPEDREMLKFLWWRDGHIITLRHCRVVFGVVCSPFLLNATITHHLNTLSGDLVERLKNSFYMDDCLCSFQSLSDAKEFVSEATNVMSQASFQLRGWVLSGDDVTQNVLGVKWHALDDLLGCNFSFDPKEKINELTKKKLLSIISRVFDPLGLLSAPLLHLKIALQMAFKLKLHWDTPLPKEIQMKCSQWLTEVDLIDSIVVPRCLRGVSDTACLHVFSDASLLGLGTCAFMRYENKDGFNVRFVLAKSRVAPMEDMSIPRKELVAATLAARLGSVISKSTNISNIVYWSDSMIVLYWIKKGEWKTFVGNRVKEIHQLTSPEQWRFVPGDCNPADILSRGCLLSEFVASKWWEGPQWLLENENKWLTVKIAPTEEESKKTAVSLYNTNDVRENLFTHFASFSKNVRVVGWIYRFLEKASGKSSNCGEELTGKEVRHAELKLVRWIQSSHPLDVNNFNIKTDDDGLIRVRTKILSDEFTPMFKEPILLPQCELVESMVVECHEKMHHAGASTVLGALREEYWIVRGRRLARRVVSKCVRCLRHKAQPVRTPPVGLPNNRVNLGKVFQVCGVDLAGPLFIKDGTRVWIALFTCAVYRAVHLEVVESLSTESFLHALRRMIARRGRITTMYSDNGTNFVGVWNLIKQTTVERELKIQWLFNVPTGAWWGGFFERLIGVMKRLLKISLGRALLNLCELMTLITEIEAVMNARPITYMSEDVNELRPITPAMFLQEQFETKVPDLDEVDEKGLSARVKYVAEVRINLKERFRQEYLGSLMLNTAKSSKNVRVGDVVWVVSDQKKRIDWELARVLEIFPGKDGVTRVAKVKTVKSELLRPVQRLCLMEIGSPYENSDGSLCGPNAVDLVPDCDSSNPPQVVESEAVALTRRGRVVKRPTKLNL